MEGTGKEQKEHILCKPYFQGLKGSGMIQGSPGNQSRSLLLKILYVRSIVLIRSVVRISSFFSKQRTGWQSPSFPRIFQCLGWWMLSAVDGGQEECVYLIGRFGFPFRPRNEVQYYFRANRTRKIALRCMSLHSLI